MATPRVMTVSAPGVRRLPRPLVVLAWAALAYLLLLGITAAVLRATHMDDSGARVEPIRTASLAMVGLADPNVPRRAAAVAQIDAKYAAHPTATMIHVVTGALLFLLVPIQLSRAVRSRHRAVHRWSGRLFVATAWIAGLGGLYFGLFHPFAGLSERVVIALLGAWFLASTSIAYVSIRRGRVSQHREWMLRAVGGALSVPMVRVVVIPIDLALTPFAVRPEIVFLCAFWIGACISVLAAERWIRLTRPQLA